MSEIPSQAQTRTSYAQIADRAEIDATERQLADALTFLPPAMRDLFEKRVQAMLELAQRVLDIETMRARSGPDLTLTDLQRTIERWRSRRR